MYVKWSRYRAGVAQRVGKGIALLFHDHDTWRVSSTPRPHFTPGKDSIHNLQEAGWAPGPVWMGGKSRPHRNSIPYRPSRSQSLYRLSYGAHNIVYIIFNKYTDSGSRKATNICSLYAQSVAKKRKKNLNSQILIEKEPNRKILIHLKLTPAHLSTSHKNQTVNFSAGTLKQFFSNCT